MPLKPTKNIWFNNELVPWESAQVHVLSYALHYGSAVFEGIMFFRLICSLMYRLIYIMNLDVFLYL